MAVTKADQRRRAITMMEDYVKQRAYWENRGKRSFVSLLNNQISALRVAFSTLEILDWAELEILTMGGTVR